MADSLLSSPKFLLTSESVTEGHPDKLCDRVSDSVLDYLLERDPKARVACETAAGENMVVVLGEITTTAKIDFEKIVRDTIKDIGYTDASSGIDYRTCKVIVNVHAQSPDIDKGVSRALETRSRDGVYDDAESLGAGDQGMMVGYACSETPEMLPLPIALAHRLTRRLATVRKDGTLSYLRPDGKSQVTVEYANGKPKRVDTVVVSTQHSADVSNERLERDIKEHVIKAVVPEELLDNKTRIFINPSGRFVLGGPGADSGLTGRKIIVDTYGGCARHGGGAFSGKDPTKVDRTGAYATRWVAKNLVAAGLADMVELQISYAIGIAAPISLNIETFGTAKVPEPVMEALVRKHFDLRPGAIIRDLNLRRPIFRQTSAYGHFGRLDLDLPWERTDKADILRAEAGLPGKAPAVRA
jgi:S-adenosylmethionine synthetase